MITRTTAIQFAPLGILAVIPFLLFTPIDGQNVFSISGNHNHNQNALFSNVDAAKGPVHISEVYASKNFAGDAITRPNYLKVTDSYINADAWCEMCVRVDYTPGSQGIAGMAYVNFKGLDLTSAKRITFFAGHATGDIKVKFLVAGKKIDGVDASSDQIFKNTKFAKTTKYVTLSNVWKKYDIDLSNVDLGGVTHPFAFEVKPGTTPGPVTFYLDYVVYDDQTAKNPVATDTT